MDRRRSQALESLEISNGFVKCQMCDVAIPMLKIMTKPKSNQIAVLQKQIKWIEEHYHYPHRRHHHGNTTDNKNNNYNVIVKQLK